MLITLAASPMPDSHLTSCALSPYTTSGPRSAFGDRYSLKRVLQQAWVASVEVGMATWKTIKTPRLDKDPDIC
ncbi:unnamed protein product [Sphagnum troendelagicum]|uniref:Uncharacterized protein n=1 Tax=Sphagnum troendelagicum TaxID=128251 RepID=A0ABP0TKB3_9BRYO